jgi:hypothetical protein
MWIDNAPHRPPRLACPRAVLALVLDRQSGSFRRRNRKRARHGTTRAGPATASPGPRHSARRWTATGAGSSCPSFCAGRHTSAARRPGATAGIVEDEAGSTFSCVPRPLQSGHMPWGELKLNICGVSSGKLMPQCGTGVLLGEGQHLATLDVDVQQPIGQARSAVSTESVKPSSRPSI